MYDLEAAGFSREGILRATIAQNLARFEAVQRKFSRETYALLNSLVASRATASEQGMQLVNKHMTALAQAAGMTTSSTDETGLRIL